MDEEDVVIAPPRVDLTKCVRDPEIRQSELYCSKLISQRGGTSFATRYEKSPLYMRILRHCFGEDVRPNAAGEYPRPTSSPFPCFNCHYTFSGPPVFLPTVHLDGRREEGKNFCSGPCAKRYIITRCCDSSQAGLVADLHEYLQDVYNINTDRIGIAPDVENREDYGGTMSEARFKAAVHNPNLLVTPLTKPFIPTEVVIENQFTIGSGAVPVPVAGGVGGPAPVAAPVQTHDPNDGGPLPTTTTTTSAVPATADAGLAAAMGRPAPQTKMHKQWKVQGLQQPKREEIEVRMASLPVLPKRKGLYEVYLQRKGQLGSDDEDDSVVGSVLTNEGEPEGVQATAIKPKSRKRQSKTAGPPETPPSAPSADGTEPTSSGLVGFLKNTSSFRKVRS